VNPNGVNRQITINGGPSYDNVFMVNGVVVNENLRGQPHSLFIEDAIQETAVMTAGISAEYGRFTGGVVSTLTKSGGNNFSGSFRDSLNNPSWTKTADYSGATKGVDTTNQVYEATLGGRVIKDRLWFFGAGRKAKDQPTEVLLSYSLRLRRSDVGVLNQLGQGNLSLGLRRLVDQHRARDGMAAATTPIAGDRPSIHSDEKGTT